jgi:DNA-binding CsgD family transcriptional regulator
LPAGERVLDEALPFSRERDIPICMHWQTGVRSRLRFAQGRWHAAIEDAAYVLDEEGMPIARLWPLLVRGLVELRTSGSGGPELDDAWALAGQIDEPLRRAAVLSALAERMWLTGVPDERVTQDAVRTVAAPSPAATAWAVGDLSVWLHRLGLSAVPPADAPQPFRSALTGRAEDAADWWHRAGEPFAEAMARAGAVDPAQRVRAVVQLDLLGATARADLRRDGTANLPARPRASSLANPAGLTNRQLDVARLLARGLTNAEIAARLFISTKTADHHVSAVLTKLQLPNRRSVALQAEALGLR